MSVLAPGTALEPVLRRASAELARDQVPGLELAVVCAGEALFAGGLGVRGVQDPTPVAATTLFHHGSCGKAYTGLLAAVLAGDGLLDLDAPVRQYVPELRLPDPVVTEEVTVRDLVSNRSGIGRHDLAWIFNPGWSAEECVRRLEHLPLAAGLREQVHYSNLGFTLAGLAIGRATGSSWAEQLRRRVLDPLGMSRTTTSLRTVIADDDRAHPHLLRDGGPVPTLWRVLDGVAPAGQLLSCAEDSLRWLSLHLGADSPLAAAVAATHEQQTVVPAGMSPFPEMGFSGYAMGWVVGHYRGHELIWHNGGIDGFATQTLLLPERGVGVVASANLHATSLPLAVVLDVADALIGAAPGEATWYDRVRSTGADHDEPAVPAQADRTQPVRPPTHLLAHYAGRYRHLGHGDVVVAAAADQLSARIGDFDVDICHDDGDSWRLRYDPLDVDGSLRFATDANRRVAEVVAELEPGSLLHFARVEE